MKECPKTVCSYIYQGLSTALYSILTSFNHIRVYWRKAQQYLAFLISVSKVNFGSVFTTFSRHFDLASSPSQNICGLVGNITRASMRRKGRKTRKLNGGPQLGSVRTWPKLRSLIRYCGTGFRSQTYYQAPDTHFGWNCISKCKVINCTLFWTAIFFNFSDAANKDLETTEIRRKTMGQLFQPVFFFI